MKLLPVALSSLSALSVAGLLLLGGPAASGASSGKVSICHNTGNGSYQVISVSTSAVDSHMQNHGDALVGTYYPDADGDGYGDPDGATNVCPNGGFVDNADDCDDTDDTINPDGEEVCDGQDNNCDGQVDEGVTSTFYLDADGDGYGNAAAPIEACSQPAGSSTDASDCDDLDPAVHPGATEVCGNGVDEDCDGQIDEGCVGCIDVLLHCDAGSDVLQTFCGPGPHTVANGAISVGTQTNASYIRFGANVNSVTITPCNALPTITVTGDTNFCDLQGGCCTGGARYNDELCGLTIN